MRASTALAGIALALSVCACAHAPDAAMGPPDYAPVAGDPAPPRARLYADCIVAAVAAGSYDRVHDPDTELVRFTCTGAPARAFYDALGPWSATIGSEFVSDGRTWRSTAKVSRDLFGVDLCSIDAAGAARCAINLNAGEFLGG